MNEPNIERSAGLPLSGVRVLDRSRVFAEPLCAMALASIRRI